MALHSKDNNTPLWSYETGTDWINEVAISADGNYIAVQTHGGAIYLSLRAVIILCGSITRVVKVWIQLRSLQMAATLLQEVAPHYILDLLKTQGGYPIVMQLVVMVSVRGMNI